MARGAQVKIMLEDEDRAPIWVSVSPLRRRDPHSAMQSAGEVIASFVANLARDVEAVERWLNGDDL